MANSSPVAPRNRQGAWPPPPDRVRGLFFTPSETRARETTRTVGEETQEGPGEFAPGSVRPVGGRRRVLRLMAGTADHGLRRVARVGRVGLREQAQQEARALRRDHLAHAGAILA